MSRRWKKQRVEQEYPREFDPAWIKKSATGCQVPFPQHPEQVWREYSDIYYWLVCGHYWTRYKELMIGIVARECHRPWRRNHLICLCFSFCSIRIFFELLRSSHGYSERWIREELLYEDNGGSSMHHVCQRADYFPKIESLVLFIPSSFPLRSSGKTIIC